MISPTFHIRADYEHRDLPEYFDDETGDLIWQPDVYRQVAELARLLGKSRVVDLGCGTGTKLDDLAGLEVIGADIGANLDEVRRRHPGGRFVDLDLGAPFDLPVAADELSGCLVMSSDVIEHLPDPSHLLAALGAAVAAGASVVLSTPERELTWGVDHMGPPPNVAHCREWSLDEFVSLVSAEVAVPAAAHLVPSLTRSSSGSAVPSTILVAVVPATEDVLAVERAIASVWPFGARDGLIEQGTAVRRHAIEIEEVRRDHAAEVARVIETWQAVVAASDERWAAELARSSEVWQAEFTAADDRWRQESIVVDQRWGAELGRVRASWEAEVAARDQQILELKQWIDELERRTAD